MYVIYGRVNLVGRRKSQKKVIRKLKPWGEDELYYSLHETSIEIFRVDNPLESVKFELMTIHMELLYFLVQVPDI